MFCSVHRLLTASRAWRGRLANTPSVSRVAATNDGGAPLSMISSRMPSARTYTPPPSALPSGRYRASSARRWSFVAVWVS
jgi:hypothetical protein